MSEKKKSPYDEGGRRGPAWWDAFSLVELANMIHGDASGRLLTLTAKKIMTALALENGKKLYSRGYNMIVGDGFMKEFKELLDSTAARELSVDGTNGGRGETIYIWPTGILATGVDIDDYLDDADTTNVFRTLTVTMDEHFTEKLDALVDAHQAPPPPAPEPAGQAFVLCDLPMQGTQLVSIGLAGAELNRVNYAPKVIAQYDRAVADLRSKHPSGRLIILDGPPGTGKTFMVRSFMKAVPESKFVIIPPHMVKDLADPNLILTFIRELDQDGNPLILVLEDADQCLSRRQAENMSSISSILNLSDGIIGSMLDMRILATTNTPAREFDEALLRKGRISAHIEIGKLDQEGIRNIWENLVGAKQMPSEMRHAGSLSLADVYSFYNSLPEVEKALAEIDKMEKSIS